MPFDDWLLGYIERGQQQDIGPGQTHRVRVLNDRVAVVFLTCRIAGVKAQGLGRPRQSAQGIAGIHETHAFLDIKAHQAPAAFFGAK